MRLSFEKARRVSQKYLNIQICAVLFSNFLKISQFIILKANFPLNSVRRTNKFDYMDDKRTLSLDPLTFECFLTFCRFLVRLLLLNCGIFVISYFSKFLLLMSYLLCILLIVIHLNFCFNIKAIQ